MLNTPCRTAWPLMRPGRVQMTLREYTRHTVWFVETIFSGRFLEASCFGTYSDCQSQGVITIELQPLGAPGDQDVHQSFGGRWLPGHFGQVHWGLWWYHLEFGETRRRRHIQTFPVMWWFGEIYAMLVHVGSSCIYIYIYTVAFNCDSWWMKDCWLGWRNMKELL